MADRLEIRPGRREYTRVGVWVLLLAFQVLLMVLFLAAAPTRIHCTRTTCWVTVDEPLVEDVEQHSTVELREGRDDIDFGGSRDIAHRFSAFLNAPLLETFDAEYAAPHPPAVGMFAVLALFLFGLFWTIRGWKVDLFIDRATSELVVRRSPWMFGGRERRGPLAGASVELHVDRRLFVIPTRSLYVFGGREMLLDLTVRKRRDYLAEVQALLQQAA